MTETFDAGCVAVTDEDGVLLVGFADDEFETTSYITLQRPHEYDAQDVALGMDRVHIERDSQAQSAYGGIEEFVLQRDRAILRLDEATGRKLGGATKLEIRFAIDSDQFDRLRSGLRRLFEGTSCLTERDTRL